MNHILSIHIPNSVTSIGNGAFECCTVLQAIYILKGTREKFLNLLGRWYNDKLREVSKDEEPQRAKVELLSTKAYEEIATALEDEYGALYTKDWLKLIWVPKDIKSYTIKNGTRVIFDFAFGFCKSLQTIHIPDSVTSIENLSFLGCESLESIYIPDSVTSIGNHAFHYCSSLRSIHIPDSVTSMGSGVFEGCESLQSIFIPEGTREKFLYLLSQWYDNRLQMVIVKNREPKKPKVELLSTEATDEEKATAVKDEYGATYTKDGLKLIRVPRDIKSYNIKDGTRIICDDAFIFCESLQSVHIPDSVTSIGESAFSSCESLQSIHIPESVTNIGDGIFSGCHIYKNIDDEIFCGCNSLKSVIIGNSLYYTKENILYSRQGRIISCWSKATDIVIPDGVTSIGDYAFYGCEALESIHIPDSVTSIGRWSFLYCTSLQYIHIPDSVTSIGVAAFWHCESLGSVHIPDSVKSIGEKAFEYCSSLQTIYIPNSVTSIGNSALEWCSSLRYIIIPEGTREKFLILLGQGYNNRLVEVASKDKEPQKPGGVRF